MHKINLDKTEIRTDLVMEQEIDKKIDKIIEKNKHIEVTETSIERNHYTTIKFNDITDKDNFEIVQNHFIKELKKYLNLKKEDKFIVIGLGNDKSTPDSLGPLTVNNILVTKSIIEKINPTKVIIIDSLKTNNLSRLAKTIQITDQGISPGSGIGNKRKEISKNTINKEVIAIGIPMVVDIKNIINTKESMIVTPTNIDFLVEKLSILIGNGINISLHKNFFRQNNKQ